MITTWMLMMLASADTAAASAAPSVYVLDVAGEGLPRDALDTVALTLAQVAQDEGLTVITKAEAQAVLQQATELVQLGANDSGLALASLGKAVGARYLLATTLTASAEDTLLSIRLIEVATAQVPARRQLKLSEHGGDLASAARTAAQLVLAPVFAHLKGTLMLEVSEEDANVLVDEAQIGVTPLAPLTLPGGHHLLTINKQGFLRHQETLRMGDGEALRRAIELRPSREFLDAWRSRNGLYRTLAWVTSGSGVALLAGAIGLSVKKANQDDETRAVNAEYAALSGAEQLNRQGEFERRRQDSINAADTLGFWAVTVGVTGALSALAGGYFWIFGDDPDRYAKHEGR